MARVKNLTDTNRAYGLPDRLVKTAGLLGYQVHELQFGYGLSENGLLIESGSLHHIGEFINQELRRVMESRPVWV